ncbi:MULTISPECIES: hypothetical protein [Amycolatopsis]|uniref:Uncharacterized protein n=1 Tax=Amycolatopsis sacchari TaxID=115433 RepID=A0A1I3VJC7_9PSEU|nr:hypothetical protein [Amycolatopsis sacchari]SFJ95272.1 hypothetical protein SAMN05421835_11145 [Amycolatopsis sacchari]
MTGTRRPGVALAGFALCVALLVVDVVALAGDAFGAFGWHAGEYTYTFVAITLAAILAGCLLKLARPPWPSFGTGLILGATLGAVALAAVGALLLIGLSQWSSAAAVSGIPASRG